MSIIPVQLTIEALREATPMELRRLAIHMLRHSIVTKPSWSREFGLEVCNLGWASRTEAIEFLKRLNERPKIPSELPPLKELPRKLNDLPVEWNWWSVVSRSTTTDEIKTAPYEARGDGTIGFGRYRYGTVADLTHSLFEQNEGLLSYTGTFSEGDNRQEFFKQIFRPLNNISIWVRVFDNYFSRGWKASSVSGAHWLLAQLVSNPTLITRQRRISVYTTEPADEMSMKSTDQRDGWRLRTRTRLQSIVADFQQRVETLDHDCDVQLEIFIHPDKGKPYIENHTRALQFAIGDKEYRTITISDSVDVFDTRNERRTAAWGRLDKSDDQAGFPRTADLFTNAKEVELFEFSIRNHSGE